MSTTDKIFKMYPHLREVVDAIVSKATKSLGYAIGQCQLKSIQEEKSAQQQVFILQLAFQTHEKRSPDMLANSSFIHDDTKTAPQEKDWSNALRSGRNRLVLRIWKGGSRWWNLHRNSSPLTLATQEIMGYQGARQALSSVSSDVPRVPMVLLFDKGGIDMDHTAENQLPSPWAVLEYVGPNSLDLPLEKVDRFYLDNMVKVRNEFGFDEPHPRWGRVTVDKSLQYAQMILRQVMMPLHQKTRLQKQPNGTSGYTYRSMVTKYRISHQSLRESMKQQQVQESQQMEQALYHLNAALTVLEGVCGLGETSVSRSQHASVVADVAPVLVHMDLQPQNLIFWRPDAISKRTIIAKEDETQNSCSVFSVLDWEDATWADPRFDLLMLCRKVCANLEQAQAIWLEYDSVLSVTSQPTLTTEKHTSCLGSIVPWLQLETVHSITTLLLQSMDLLNGGRNPWETKKDLWGKLQREFVRWGDMNARNECEASEP
jgi:thiamine kinase-like enzyme